MEYLSEGANSWQLTAATFVGLMSIPGLVVLYGGVMQKRWSVNSMMMAFVAFAVVLDLWVLVGFKLAFGDPIHLSSSGFFAAAKLSSTLSYKRFRPSVYSGKINVLPMLLHRAGFWYTKATSSSARMRFPASDK